MGHILEYVTTRLLLATIPVHYLQTNFRTNLDLAGLEIHLESNYSNPFSRTAPKQEVGHILDSLTRTTFARHHFRALPSNVRNQIQFLLL